MFRSFFQGGFECATGFNRHGQWIDQVKATQHDYYLEEDYARLREKGIYSVREGVRWPIVDSHGKLDLTSVRAIVEASRSQDMEIIYDLFHYGYPVGLDPFAPEFADRFAAYCYEVAKCVTRNSDGPYFFTAVNEPSYFSWSAGEVGHFAPHLTGRGYELKYALVRAAIQGIDAIWSAEANARIISIDPICHVVPSSPEFERDAQGFNESVVFQSLDMLSGRLHPELGGSHAHLGTIGINYYWKNQWMLGGDTLEESDPRRIPFRDIIRRVYERYGSEMLISETAHVGDARAGWIEYITDEVSSLIEDGVPIHGICLYPILGMPEWHAQEEWVRMGLWDLELTSEGMLHRRPEPAALGELQRSQQRIEALLQRRKAEKNTSSLIEKAVQESVILSL